MNKERETRSWIWEIFGWKRKIKTEKENEAIYIEKSGDLVG